MVSTTAVKHALAALATRTDTATGPYVGVIDEADAARDDLRRAAGFVEAVGLERLATAVDAAAADGCHDIAARGRDTLRDYRRFRAVAGELETPDLPESNARSDSAAAVEGENEASRSDPEPSSSESTVSTTATSTAIKNNPSSDSTAQDNPSNSNPSNSNPSESTAENTGPLTTAAPTTAVADRKPPDTTKPNTRQRSGR